MLLPPNTPILTSTAMRDAEAVAVDAGTSLSALMDRAGAAVADMAWRMAAGAPILILAGPGNNGGDGYVAARCLAERGARVHVAASGEARTDLAQAARQAWGGPVESLSADTKAATVVVDALFGAGLRRPLDELLTAALQALGNANPRVIAVDLPSGVESDGAAVLSPPLRADVTVALGALKPAHVLLPAAAWCGKLVCADIGIAAEQRMRTLGEASSPSRRADANKYTQGMVMVRAGTMSGAAGLAAGAALRAGAGYVVLNNVACAPQLAIICEDADQFVKRLADRRLGATVIGPGYLAGEALDADVARLLASKIPAVLDAAAIDAAVPLLCEGGGRCPAILTPHSGEFDRAFPGLAGSKIDRTRAAAAQTGAVVLHKGADTIIAAPDGRVVAAWPGSPWLATAGTGDVLAGACGAMMARGMDAFDAAVAACGWHIAAATRIGPGLIADDLLDR